MSYVWMATVIVGPLLFGLILLWSLMRNREAGRRAKADTEAATRDLYREENRVAHADGAVENTPVDTPPAPRP